MPGQETKYQQVIDWVKENIKNGSLRPGDRLMSENEMSERFGLSRQTIRRATGELVGQNILTRMQGSGTYISGMPGEERQTYMNIAVISTFTESYIFPGILKGIVGYLGDCGYTTQISFTDNQLKREKIILKQILEKDSIDGLIVEPVKSALPNPNTDYYKEILARKIPVMFFNTFYPQMDIPCVRIDDSEAACKATKLLLDAGHESIGAIFKSDDGQGPLRYDGFIRTMLKAGKQLDQTSVIWVDTIAALDLGCIEEYLFSRLEKFTGVVCYNDQIAYQLVNMALERGIRVPEDLSVVGIDDSYLAQVCKVPFSSISHPKEQLGCKVAENMVKMIHDPGYDGGCLMDVDTVERESVRTMN